MKCIKLFIQGLFKKRIFIGLTEREKQLIDSSLTHTITEYVDKYNFETRYRTFKIYKMIRELKKIQTKFDRAEYKCKKMPRRATIVS